MANPVIAGKNPAVVELEPGTYYWCSCGKSQKQPFCDGAHKGSEFKPHKVEVTEKKKVPFCMCKHTKMVPWCDGAHTKL